MMVPAQAEVVTPVDDVQWHLDGDFPEGANREGAATHMGMFLAWVIARGLGSLRHYDRRSLWGRRLTAQAVGPGAFFLRTCGGRLGHDEFSPVGWMFAKAVYDHYVDDFGCMFADPNSPTFPHSCSASHAAVVSARRVNCVVQFSSGGRLADWLSAWTVREGSWVCAR